VNGFSAAALLIQGLRPPAPHDPVRHQAALRRMAILLGLQLALMLGLTLALR